MLEIGGGTLNHLPYEPEVADYDVVEPFEALYSESANRPRVRRIFPNIEEVPKESRYDRIVSIAALEHLEDLPKIIARSALLLSEGGIAQHSIPSEGGMLWGVSWRLTTGLAYRLRNGLSYGVAMRHEHINDAPEIIAVLAWFFERVEIRRYPVPFHHVSLYTYVEATHPRCDRCREYLEGRGTRADQTPTIGNFRIEERLVEDARLPTVLAASITFARSRHSLATRPAAG